MRRFGRRFSRRKWIPKKPIQHTPALIGNAPGANTGLLHVLAHAGTLAGGSMTGSRTGGEDRTTEVDNGRHVNTMIVNIGFIPAGGTSGYYELGFIKYERSFTTPAVGSDPVPSTADMVGDGLQRAVRSLTPGYMIKYMQIPVTAETVTTRSIKVNWRKYKKDLVRDGDYFTLLIFNRTAGAGTYDITTRYTTSAN